MRCRCQFVHLELDRFWRPIALARRPGQSRSANLLRRVPVSRPFVFPPALHEQLAVFRSAMRHPRYGVHVAAIHPYAIRWGATPGAHRGYARLGAHGRVLPFHGCIFLAGVNMLLHAPAVRTPSVSRPRMWRSLWPRNIADEPKKIKSVALSSLALHFLDSAERRFTSTLGSAATLRVNAFAADYKSQSSNSSLTLNCLVLFQSRSNDDTGSVL